MTLAQTTKFIPNSWLRIAQISICIALITSCSSSEPSRDNSSSSSKQSQQIAGGSESLINKADDLGIEQGRSHRIQAAELAIKEQHSIGYIKKILTNVDLDTFGTIDEEISLINSKLYVKNYEDAEYLLKRLKQGALPPRYQVPMWLLTAQVSSHKNLHLDTVRTLFRTQSLYAKRLTKSDKIMINELLWQHIVQIPAPSLNKIVNDFGSEAASWVNLSKIIQSHIGTSEQFTIEMQAWYDNYASFNNADYLPEQIKTLLSVVVYEPQKLALLLPLSGSISLQAKTIRNGFLANTEFSDDIEITIIDTEAHTLAEIEKQLTEKKVEFIVGPLKKERITQFQKSEVLSNIPTLYLNSIELEQYNNETQYYFSLAPEDEINQAVDYFISKGIEHPALIYADNSLGRRLAQQFEQQWLFNTDKHIETIAFKNKSKLGVAVKNLLDVNYSEKRVREMRNLFGAQLKTENRSRNDIDAIYVIANSQQTRLIKPFFDTNVSVFNKLLPIYASSRSFLIGETRSQKRDLNGLTFTEMPWLVKNTDPQATQIFNQVSDKHTQLKKLFAFGYDAKHLIPLLSQLQVLSGGMEFSGLTGKLRLNEQNTIKRSLDWSRYQQGNIVVLKKLTK